ncbi:MAG: ATP-binding cassette domain-containing protein, partial [Polaromonas sp.]
MSLRIESLHKSFEGLWALENIELQVGAAEFVCLLGPSGCGKTTLLRIIAGLLNADSGRILLNERDLATRPARERGFGIVFQS